MHWCARVHAQTCGAASRDSKSKADLGGPTLEEQLHLEHFWVRGHSGMTGPSSHTEPTLALLHLLHLLPAYPFIIPPLVCSSDLCPTWEWGAPLCAEKGSLSSEPGERPV